MPLILGQQPIGLTVTVEDRDKNRAGTTFYFPNTLTIVDLLSASAQAEAVVAALSNGNIVGGSISIPLTQNMSPSVPSENSDIERKGVLTFTTSNPASVGRLEIPSLDNSFVIDGTDVISGVTFDLAVAALISFGATNGVGFDLTGLKEAYKRHRRSRRG